MLQANNTSLATDDVPLKAERGATDGGKTPYMRWHGVKSAGKTIDIITCPTLSRVARTCVLGFSHFSRLLLSVARPLAVSLCVCPCLCLCLCLCPCLCLCLYLWFSVSFRFCIRLRIFLSRCPSLFFGVTSPVFVVGDPSLNCPQHGRRRACLRRTTQRLYTAAGASWVTRRTSATRKS